MSKRKPRALGCHIFAGGFTVGVARKFRVMAHLEAGNYGVDTFKLNFPRIPVHVGNDEWPIDDLAKAEIDFVYGNPPCAPWSPVGVTGKHGGDAWKTDPRVEHWHSVFGLLEQLKPHALAIESVPRCYSPGGGQPLMHEFAERAINMGYNVTCVFMSTITLGMPQDRRRFFFIAHRWKLDLAMPQLDHIPTVGETIDPIEDPGHVIEYPEWLKPLVPLTEQGGKLRQTWDRLNPDPEKWEHDELGRVKTRPRFMDHRLEPDKPSGAIIGDYYIHPTEDRRLGSRELCALCGYPIDYQFVGTKGCWPNQIARSVMPPVGEWLAGCIIDMMKRKESIVPGLDDLDLRPDSGKEIDERQMWLDFGTCDV